MRERDTQGRVIGHARHRGVICRKLDFGQGWPDYMLLTDGEILFMEFKGRGGRIAPLQDYMHGVLRGAGFVVHVVDNVEAGTLIIEEWIEDVRPMSKEASVVDYSVITKGLLK